MHVMDAWMRASCKKFLATHMTQKDQTQIRAGPGCSKGLEEPEQQSRYTKRGARKKATEEGQEQDTGFAW